MSKVIPKEQLTAYQRWELADVDDGAPPQVHQSGGNNGHLSPHDSEKFVLPTAEEVERLHQQAWQEGYQLGLEEGRQAGFEAGQRAGESHVNQLRALADALEVGRLHQDEAIAREVLALAVTVAQQVVRRAISVKPDLILDAIREALLSLPSLSGHHKIVAHPDHVQLVQDWLAQEHGHLSWKVTADPLMAPGSFRFESTYNELDGSMRTRWQEIADCLDIDGSWLT